LRIRSACNILAACLIWLAGARTGTATEAASVHLLLPRHRILPLELAVIVNDADPLSVRIADYYRRTRNLPADNLIHVKFEPGSANMSSKQFAAIKRTIDSATAPHIQAYALTWVEPYRVDCMSITSAVTFGFDRDWCSAKRCALTRRSPLFGYRGAAPFDDRGVRPTMSIAARDFAQAKALIDRGVRADQTQPGGTAYLLSTSDKARNVRAVVFDRIAAAMQGWIDTRVIHADALEDRDDVLFYFTGLTRVAHLDTLRFRPGAIADHLTSAGGRLTGKGQMSALRWLESGATGSYGTVVEPCNRPGKFPNPGLVMASYGSGRTLIEAYWQSVQQPGEGIFIGEPLAAPYAGYRHKIESDRIILQTRVLMAGIYRLDYSRGPVGPYRPFSRPLDVRHHQQIFTLPLAGPGYYRFTPVDRR
jgi:uncharacterized protein (TIGR03790 family)